MEATTPEVVIDEQVASDLQPPCENRKSSGETCSRPAAWILRLVCGSCNRGVHALLCGKHTGEFMSGYPAQCLTCGQLTDYTVDSVVRL